MSSKALKTVKMGDYILHSIPDNDTHLHIAAEDCWCHPLKCGLHGSYTHNAADCRETVERRTNKSAGLGLSWTTVGARPFR